MVPSYQGTSSYLIFCQVQQLRRFDDGDGVNRIALLDPNATQIDPHSSANGLVEMREVLTIIGPTPDAGRAFDPVPVCGARVVHQHRGGQSGHEQYLHAERGWPHLPLESRHQFVIPSRHTHQGIGEPYVPTVIGPDGIVYTLNGGTLFALGGLNGVGVTLVSSVPDVRPVVVGQSLTFTATVTNTGSSGVIPTGTVTFQDFTYQDLTPVTTTSGFQRSSGRQWTGSGYHIQPHRG